MGQDEGDLESCVVSDARRLFSRGREANGAASAASSAPESSWGFSPRPRHGSGGEDFDPPSVKAHHVH